MDSELTQIATSQARRSVLPDSWIEKIFQKFEDFYGAKWAAQYGDFPRDRVKATWAEELSGFSSMPAAIGEAMQSQKSNKFPPTLPEFLELCRNAAKRISPIDILALDYKPTSEELEKGREIAERAAKVIRMEHSYDYKGWAKKLRHEYLSGLNLNNAQISAASHAMGEVWENRSCTPMVQPA